MFFSCFPVQITYTWRKGKDEQTEAFRLLQKRNHYKIVWHVDFDFILYNFVLEVYKMLPAHFANPHSLKRATYPTSTTVKWFQGKKMPTLEKTCVAGCSSLNLEIHACEMEKI